jgi:hypothetical protein
MLNPHLPLLLLQCGDIESNPGPHTASAALSDWYTLIQHSNDLNDLVHLACTDLLALPPLRPPLLAVTLDVPNIPLDAAYATHGPSYFPVTHTPHAVSPLDHFLVKHAPPDGDCLLHSIRIATLGLPNSPHPLRLRTLLTFISHWRLFSASPNLHHHPIQEAALHQHAHTTALELARPGTPLNLSAVATLATVIDRPILLLCPLIAGKEVATLNTQFFSCMSRIPTSSRPPVILCWSDAHHSFDTTTGPSPFSCNHFVPAVPTDTHHSHISAVSFTLSGRAKLFYGLRSDSSK